jgi:hypothetical protein
MCKDNKAWPWVGFALTGIFVLLFARAIILMLSRD